MTSKQAASPKQHESAKQPRELLARIAPPRALEVVGPSGIATGRMVLRPLRESDRAFYLRAIEASRADLEAWIPLNNPGESDDEFFARQLALAQAGDQSGSAWRRVGVLADGRIAGSFNLNCITRGLQSSADANWWVASGLTGQGLATEGVRAMLRHALTDLPAGLGLHTVHAGISALNTRSVRLAKALGMHHDAGVQSYLKVGERWELHDIYCLSVLDESPSLAG